MLEINELTQKHFDIAIVIPTLNEEAGIAATINSVQDALEGKFSYHVVVVDGASSDKTVEIAKSLGAKKPRIAIKEELPNINWCHVCPNVRGSKRAEKAGVDIIIASGREGGAHCAWRDVSSMVLLPEVVKNVNIPVVGAGGFSDGASLAAALALGAIGVQMGTRFIATKEADLIIGSRYINKGGIKNWGFYRKITSRGGTFYAKSILDLKINDLTSGYRCYKRQVLETLNLSKIRSEGYSFQIETAYKIKQAGFKIKSCQHSLKLLNMILIDCHHLRYPIYQNYFAVF